jgi:FlaA1/EpsC-like NDP-sugar epimerase
MLEDKNILVTGGGGSVGTYLARRFLECNPGVIRLIDNNEPGISALTRTLTDDRYRFLLGDIRDRDRMERAMEDIDVVIHTAAMKHVDLSEYNPFEAVKTNVLGLQNVVDAAIETGVERVVFTSSDKAASPANTMGATKLLGENLITAGNKYKGRPDLKLSSVRFGNVINSSESVIPLFTDQIKQGGPVTLTDARMTRFFLTYDDIWNLVLNTLDLMEGGEVFLHTMDAIKIEDLAEVMIEVLGPQFGNDPSQIDIELIGRRPGETLHEKIMTHREAETALQTDDMYVIPPASADNGHYLQYPDREFGVADDIVVSSKNATKLEKDEIREMVERGDLLGVDE